MLNRRPRHLKSLLFQALAAIGCVGPLWIPTHALGTIGDSEPRQSDEAVRNANKQVMDQIRAGNRDPQKLMRILGPALKTRDDELKAEAEDHHRQAQDEGRELLKKPGGRARAPAPSVAETPSVPIVDPSSVPRELSFEKRTPAPPKNVAPGVPGSASAPDGDDASMPASSGGVSEVSFESAPKPTPAPRASPARRLSKP